MSATLSQTVSHPRVPGQAVPSLRFGAESGFNSETPSAQWLLKRNCSITPRQMLAFYGSLCVLSLAIATVFWVHGASLVMPFATLELVVLGAALLLFSRHATDRETIRLLPGSLTVEHVLGHHVERAEFAPAWVRVEPQYGAGSLIEISGQGQRIAIGRFVRPELRRQLADELRGALRRWQGLAGRTSVAPAAADPDNTEH